MKGRVGMNHLLSINSHPKLLPRAQTERVWHLTIFASSFSPFFFSPPSASALSSPGQNQQQKCRGKKKEKKSVFTVFLNLSPGLRRIWQGFTNLWENPCGDLRKPASLLKKASCVGQKLGKNWLFQLRFPLRFWIWTWSSTLRIKCCSDWLYIYWNKYITLRADAQCTARRGAGSKWELVWPKPEEERGPRPKCRAVQVSSNLLLWFSSLNKFTFTFMTSRSYLWAMVCNTAVFISGHHCEKGC